MKDCYFLVDNVLQSPHSGITLRLPGEVNTRPLDYVFGHFDNFSYNNFFHINQIKFLDDKPKYLLNIIHMPEWTEINLSKKSIEILQNDPTVFLCLVSVLECIISPKALAKELASHKIPASKVVVLCSDLSAHMTIKEGVKYICVNFWESISRHHHQTLPNVASTHPDELKINDCTKKFLCLNRNIKPHRIWLMYSMIKADILKQGHVSFNLPEVDFQNFTEVANSEFVYKRIPVNLHKDYKMALARAMYQRKLDELDKVHVINYKDSIKPYYNDSLMSVITESDSNKNFITEKTYKAIMNLHPFFIIGNPDQHSLLRARGYFTFEDLFEVEQVTQYYEAMDLWNNIKNTELCVLKEKINKKYIDKLIHNQQLFLSRKISWNNIIKNIIEFTID